MQLCLKSNDNNNYSPANVQGYVVDKKQDIDKCFRNVKGIHLTFQLQCFHFYTLTYCKGYLSHACYYVP